jgi:hypothetical protein
MLIQLCAKNEGHTPIKPICADELPLGVQIWQVHGTGSDEEPSPDNAPNEKYDDMQAAHDDTNRGSDDMQASKPDDVNDTAMDDHIADESDEWTDGARTRALQAKRPQRVAMLQAMLLLRKATREEQPIRSREDVTSRYRLRSRNRLLQNVARNSTPWPAPADERVKGIIIEPTVDPKRTGYWHWENLYVAPSTQKNGGTGLFAATDLPKGWCFIILGWPTETTQGVYIWTYTAHAGGHQFATGTPHSVDGDPSLSPNNAMGCFGLAAAMRANEESRNRRHNCVFGRNLLIVGRPIPRNTELTVYYGEGDDYTRTGYTMNNNTLRADDPDGYFHAIQLPTVKPVIERWSKIIQQRIEEAKAPQ